MNEMNSTIYRTDNDLVSVTCDHIQVGSREYTEYWACYNNNIKRYLGRKFFDCTNVYMTNKYFCMFDMNYEDNSAFNIMIFDLNKFEYVKDASFLNRYSKEIIYKEKSRNLVRRINNK